MRYLMKQKFWSLGDRFSVLDAKQAEVFSVSGKGLSLSGQLSVQDAARNEVAQIQQKMLSWTATYEVTRGGRPLGTVKRDLFPLLRSRFVVSVPGGEPIVAEGDLLDHEYTFRQGDAQIARVSKAMFSWLDTYGIDVNEGQNDVLIVCAAVVIDRVCHSA